MLSQDNWCTMLDISKIRINDPMIRNFVMKVIIPRNYGNAKFGPHSLNSKRVRAVRILKAAIIHQFVTVYIQETESA